MSTQPKHRLGNKKTIAQLSALATAVSAGLFLAGCSTPNSAETRARSEPVSSPVQAKPTPSYQSAPVIAAAMSRADASLIRNSSYPVMPAPQPKDRDNYQDQSANPVHRTAESAVATLSIDTDTGSYANVRRYINEGQLPPADAVRAEELINYFSYSLSDGKRLGNAPFVVATEVVDSPWDKATQDNKIVKVGIKAVDSKWSAKSTNTALPPANLVFLVDVSGSMDSRDKLPLAQAALKLLTQQMRAQDTISIVTYSGRTDVVLPATTGDKKSKILAAIEGLRAAGSTNGEDALKLAYRQASQNMQKDGINRILMLTDGDFNVGISDVDEMLDLVKSQRDKGISLSTVGFGRGNLNDYMMEKMADNGNGNYSYIDSLTEAKKVFSDELAATFNTVAKDVKIQVEFNPSVIAEWRLIGYENRVLAEEDFNNDKVDAGELGAGKAVIALFEVTPVGKPGLYSERRYGSSEVKTPKTNLNELGYLKIRYKDPTGGASKLLNLPIANSSRPLTSAHTDTQFAIAVAGFAQRLGQGQYINNWHYTDSGKLAEQSLTKAVNSDNDGTRRGFIELTKLANALEQVK